MAATSMDSTINCPYDIGAIPTLVDLAAATNIITNAIANRITKS